MKRHAILTLPWIFAVTGRQKVIFLQLTGPLHKFTRSPAKLDKNIRFGGGGGGWGWGGGGGWVCQNHT